MKFVIQARTPAKAVAEILREVEQRQALVQKLMPGARTARESARLAGEAFAISEIVKLLHGIEIRD